MVAKSCAHFEVEGGRAKDLEEAEKMLSGYYAMLYPNPLLANMPL